MLVEISGRNLDIVVVLSSLHICISGGIWDIELAIGTMPHTLSGPSGAVSGDVDLQHNLHIETSKDILDIEVTAGFAAYRDA